VSDLVVIDSGVANLGSVLAALERAGIPATLSVDPARIRAASHVILPGVGAAQAAMRQLEARGLVDVIRGLSQPVLGICLGMQLLFEASDEGDTACLGVLPGRVQRFAALPGLRVPHMGWNRLEPTRPHALTAGMGDAAYAYFVHSYRVPEAAYTLAACEHGERFSAIVAHRNFHGAQFHPERSAAVGARLLQNFVGLAA
jgi:glutamine amidotransferase